MTTTTPRFRSPALAALAALGLAAALAVPARAQEPARPQDEALDSLLEKLGEGAEPKDPPAADARKDEEPTKKADDKQAGDAKDEGAGAPKPDAPGGKPGEAKAGGDVSPEDQSIDELLEKLGATKDEPAAEDRPRQPGGGGPPGEPKGGAGGGKDDRREPELSGEDRRIDEELEELLGRKRKRDQPDRRQGEASGPMGQIVKEMRDVEERLGKPDTGDDTRSRQREIVKQLDTMIQKIRQSGSQSGKGSKEVRQAGNKPGDQQQGDQPGANASGAPMSRPARPTDKHALAGGKDAWGHLPPELRQEIDNLFKEDSLPAAEELIRRYYLSVSRKKVVRGE
jgi:hypothetical protein